MAQGTFDGTSVLGKHDRRSGDPAARPSGDQPRRHQGAERGPTDPQPCRRPVALRRPQRSVAQPHRVLLDPGGLGPHLFRRVRGRTLQTRHQRRSGRRPHPHVGGGHLGHGARRGGGGRLPPPQYGAHRPWVHTVDAEVILHLLRHADRERTTGVPAGAAKVVNQMPLQWLRDGLCARRQHAGHPFWYVRATSHHSDALLHKADWAASQDTVLQNTPPDPGHAQLIVAGRDGHLDLRPPTMRALGEVAQRAQTDHALTHRGHTPLGAAHATAYVHAWDLTATATNRRALRA